MAASMPRLFVAYARVSTAKQGRSGLGLEAQQEAIRNHLSSHGGHLLLPVFVEVESGRTTSRPQLDKALAKCRATGATLLIAKLDRLSRDAHFLLGLQKAEVDFVAADMPHANRLTVGVMALVAEEEARAVSARTKAALAAAKTRGKKLGGLREGQRPPSAKERLQGAQRSLEVRQRAASNHAHLLAPRLLALREQGASLHEIARTLEAEGMPTPRDGSWTATAVRRVLARISDGQNPQNGQAACGKYPT
ncbi:recombinase family protein [Sabulicella rubraurantiaca]|uniref:recombinase family protein n=1 Tax=Sabulicella rubraurantiaca TaxID=2811429 RepID=UPI002E2D2D5E|nr:recombinase family protein [Sabulicella rubraurantiaca]